MSPPPEPIAPAEGIGSSDKKLKKKKGKEKDEGGGRRSNKKRKGKETDFSNGDTLAPVHDESETPEDEAERARVRSMRLLSSESPINAFDSGRLNGELS